MNILSIPEDKRSWYGFLNARLKWLQFLDTPKWFLFFLTQYYFTQSCVITGLYPGIASTIEKCFAFSRYDLPKFRTGERITKTGLIGLNHDTLHLCTRFWIDEMKAIGRLSTDVCGEPCQPEVNFFILGKWSCLCFRADRLCKSKDSKQYKFGSVEAY